MSNKLQDWMPLIIAALTPVFTFLVEGQDPIYKYIVIAVMVVLVIVVFLYNKIKTSKNLSNTAVIDKSRKYTKYLKKLVKANASELSKEFNKSELAEMRKNISLVTKKINGSYKSNKKEEIANLIKEQYSLLDKYYGKSSEYVSSQMIDASKPIIKMVKLADMNESRLVFNKIYDTIHDIERILLQLEQHDLRIKFGKYIVKYSIDIDKTIHAYVDYIGWTNVLLGKNEKGFKAIKKGLDLIEYKIKINEPGHLKYIELKEKGEEISEYYEMQHVEYCENVLQKARTLRHFGTTYYTYRSHSDSFVKEEFKSDKAKDKKNELWTYENTVNPFVKNKLAEAIKLMEEESVKEYFDRTQKLKETYFKMVFGLKYNDLLYDYYVALYKNDESLERFIDLDRELEELRKEVDVCGFDDNHRLIKILTLKNQLQHKIINKSTLKSNIKTEKELLDKWNETLSSDLKTIEKVLNKNIYFDEAMEVYVCQKVRKLYTDIEEIFENNL